MLVSMDFVDEVERKHQEELAREREKRIAKECKKKRQYASEAVDVLIKDTFGNDFKVDDGELLEFQKRLYDMFGYKYDFKKVDVNTLGEIVFILENGECGSGKMVRMQDLCSDDVVSLMEDKLLLKLKRKIGAVNFVNERVYSYVNANANLSMYMFWRSDLIGKEVFPLVWSEMRKENELPQFEILDGGFILRYGQMTYEFLKKDYDEKLNWPVDE